VSAEKFSEFMTRALYAPGTGYYTRGRDPFGIGGDFYTATQVQPVFGRLMARAVEHYGGGPVLEIGCGRREMAPYFAPFGYVGVDAGDEWPQRHRGVLFANELFDALAVDVVKRADDGWREVLVEDGRFVEGARVSGEAARYIEANALEGTERMEIPVGAPRMLERMAGVMEAGAVVVIDYGYTRRELLRFPQGTLMAYRGHRALDDVLKEPGTRDITAHVAWDPLEEHALRLGWKREFAGTLQKYLLELGERDAFAAALEGDAVKHTGQLKTLLFGMGETFRVVVWRV
jgi:SAM-dependent MidA family methyltransferase